MDSITKWLTYPDATQYPFPFQIGDRVRSTTKNIQGTVKNAKYAGTDQDNGPFWITYYIETDTGQITQLPLNELEKIGVH